MAKDGFALKITAVDEASKRIDALNRRIAALYAPVDKFNRSAQKFGDVTGINQAAQGIGALGEQTLGAARAAERLASTMPALTGAASLAGVAELSRRWADAGNSIAKAAYQLNAPVERVSALRGAARLAGSSAEAMDSSLQGLNETLSAAHWHRPGAPIALLNQLRIGFDGVGGRARTATNAMGDVADAVARYKGDPNAQKRLLEGLGMSPDLLPLLSGGRKSLEDYRRQAERTGGLMTGQMAEDAKKLRSSWEELGETIEGVGNRIVDKWSGTATTVINRTSHWIERNKALSDSVAQIGAAISGLALLRPAAWLLRLLGLGAVATGAGAVAGAVFGEEALYRGTRIGSTVSQADEDAIIHGPGWTDGRTFLRRAGPRAGSSGGNALDPATVARARAVHDKLMGAGIPGMTDARAWGFAGNAVQESRADPNTKPGDEGPAHGLFMWRDDRLKRYVARYGHLPEQGTLDEQIDFTKYELTGPEATAWRDIRASANTPGEAGAAISYFWERPKDKAAEESRRWGIASQLAAGAAAGQTGHVHVTVDLKGAPRGTVANAVASGAATAAPPRVETAMPWSQ